MSRHTRGKEIAFRSSKNRAPPSSVADCGAIDLNHRNPCVVRTNGSPFGSIGWGVSPGALGDPEGGGCHHPPGVAFRAWMSPAPRSGFPDDQTPAWLPARRLGKKDALRQPFVV
ncbi:hypothetical protein HPB52_002417 [Rhipicephalus sanguineus]|uniref:Uncharacterized protein n=1 Tax=Rhipicephalus sanguineus TaxID=34632 RepID=A0A9D4PS86_RHISA|nr:hypothetical protein HPB52_002417 [Rhipicephalus sanguineus]